MRIERRGWGNGGSGRGVTLGSTSRRVVVDVEDTLDEVKEVDRMAAWRWI